MPPASLGSFPRLASGSDPGSFKIIAYALGLKVCKILCVPFRSGVYFAQPSGFSENKPPWSSKPNVLEAHLASAGLTSCGA